MIPSLFLSEEKIDRCLEKLTQNTQVSCASVNIASLNAQCEIHGETVLLDYFLTDREKKKFSSFAYDKRKKEWFAGRVAAKHAAIRLFSQQSSHKSDPDSREWKKWEVSAGASGRPQIVSKQGKPDISISHSGGVAVAMAIRKGTGGIDIQKITSKVVTVEKKFISTKEKKFKKSNTGLNHLSDEKFLTLIWSAKEALRKGSGHKPIIGFLEMKLDLVKGDLDLGLIFQFVCARKSEQNQKNKFTTYQNVSDDFAVSFMVDSVEKKL